MTERGLPSDGAPACPFVAFEDDRDARSTVPDHRHRCFAEARPAPRALAHQEAYCLSSAFPVCPTFQDWARREAAAARPAPASLARDDATAASRATPPLDRGPQETGPYPGEPVTQPRNSGSRDWAAPPPWTGEPSGGSGAGLGGAAAAAAAASGAAAGTGAGAGAAGAGAAGAGPAAGAGAMWGSAPDDDGDFTTDDGVDDVPVVPPRAVPPDAGPSSSGGSGQPQDAASRGLAGSAAYRLAGPDPDEPPPATPQREGDPGEWPSRGAAASGAAAASASPVNADQRGSSGRAADGAPAPRSDASELFGPAWEAPRRYEAYPTLRTRVGLPSFAGVPRVAIAAGGLILAAVLVFAFGPGLLGFGKTDQPGGGAAATPTATASASETPEPTVVPSPTPTVYIVAKGDTFSKIAKKLGVTVEVLKAANPQIKNIDKIQIGDQVNIPQAVENGGDGSAEP